MAADPTKLSHHVHRIGYHFHSEVLEQAVADLNYTLHKGQFVKEEDLAKKRQESLTAQILLKHGIRVQDMSNAETPDQVQGAIKELFPRIPSDDLDQIVDHAWAEGTGRVGNAQQLDLPRRVQLAVIARIRHKYTDYDQLLRAFEWKEARKMTEAPCLEKLIEWRGEQDMEEDDQQLEEMVRETIVIEDDDAHESLDDSDTLANGSEADDEDSAAEQGDNSDASIEVTRHLADDTDIGGESSAEAWQPLRRWQQMPRRSLRQHNLARQKINEAKMRAAARPSHAYAHQNCSQSLVLTCDSSIDTVHLPNVPNGAGFSMNGTQYHPASFRASAAYHDRSADNPQIQAPHMQPSPTYTPMRQSQGVHLPQHMQQAASASNGTYSKLRSHVQMQDSPVASIEGSDNHGQTARARPVPQYGHVRSRPVTPQSSHSAKRRRVEHEPQRAQYGYGQPMNGELIDLTIPEQRRQRPGVPFVGGVVDLMTPEPPFQPVHPSPLREVRNAPFEYRQPAPRPQYQPVRDVAAYHQPSPMRISPQQAMESSSSYQNEAEDLEYDPTQPMLQLPQQVDRLSIRPEQYQRPAYSNMPNGWPLPSTQPPSQPPPPPARQHYEVPQQPAYAQTFQQQPVFTYPTAPPPRFAFEQQQPSRPTPQPMHGAPALVQVLPRHLPQQSYRPPTVPPPLPPTDGAPAPVQLIPRQFPHSGYG